MRCLFPKQTCMYMYVHVVKNINLYNSLKQRLSVLYISLGIFHWVKNQPPWLDQTQFVSRASGIILCNLRNNQIVFESCQFCSLISDVNILWLKINAKWNFVNPKSLYVLWTYRTIFKKQTGFSHTKGTTEG